MSTEFKPKDRVSINKDLAYTAPRFSSVEEMRTIFTGTITHVYKGSGEVTVMLDYPDDVPESKRISYSYDTRDLTLISRMFKPNDKVLINKDLPYTTPRFGTSKDMREFSTGVVVYVDENDVVDGAVATRVHLDTDRDTTPDYFYDPRDLTLISRSSESKPSHFKLKDRVKVESLKHTRDRFGIVEKMSEILTGTVDYVDESLNEVQLKLDGDDDDVYLYDPKDLTLIPDEPKPKRKKGRPCLDVFGFDKSRTLPTPTNVKTSNNKTTVEFSDNTTTSVTKSAGDPYDLETAIAYCIAKKIVTNSCIKHLAKNAEEVVDKVNTEFYNKFLKPYGFLNGGAYFDVEIETLKNYLKTLNDVRADLALIAIENDLTKDELFDKLKG